MPVYPGFLSRPPDYYPLLKSPLNPPEIEPNGIRNSIWLYLNYAICPDKIRGLIIVDFPMPYGVNTGGLKKEVWKYILTSKTLLF